MFKYLMIFIFITHLSFFCQNPCMQIMFSNFLAKINNDTIKTYRTQEAYLEGNPEVEDYSIDSMILKKTKSNQIVITISIEVGILCYEISHCFTKYDDKPFNELNINGNLNFIIGDTYDAYNYILNKNIIKIGKVNKKITYDDFFDSNGMYHSVSFNIEIVLNENNILKLKKYKYKFINGIVLDLKTKIKNNQCKFELFSNM